MSFRYFFRTKRTSPADMPKNPVKVCNYDRPVYTREFECDTFGYAEYDRPVQACDIEKYNLMASAVNILPFVRLD